MPKRRILSLWFPRLEAERLIRAARGLHAGPLAVVAEQSNMQVITSLNAEAQTAGLRVGQPVRDAHAMCATLITRHRNAPAEAALLSVIETDCADMGLSVQMGIADTLGAAWALARYAGHEATSDRNGDAISLEARATRARRQNGGTGSRAGPRRR
ncbi:hypothetical protein [Ruegeria atlantica]|uniref:Y-family DNA polymerase n=1 Tax=Ruegeria atlantica TaxID=81569 RepID=UPI003F689CE0